MADIKIKVEGRIATNLTPEVKLVTKNDGYTVEFEFDETWSVSSLKTALFIANGHCIPVPFVGNVCNVPMLVGVELLNVGVKSDDVLGLQTTTAAKVLCVLSADDLVVDEIPAPSQSVYDRIVEMINLGMVKGDKGDKGDKGEKGDAGAIKFVTVVALPTENIQEDAIYLVPIEGNPEENLYTEYVYVNGTWEQLGSISVQVDHSEYVKFTDVGSGLSVSKSNGSIYINGATSNQIKMKQTPYYPIVPTNQDYAWKVSATTNTETWTDEEKAEACETIGAVTKKINLTTYSQAYVKGSGGTQAMLNISSSVVTNSLVQRTANGEVKGQTPTATSEGKILTTKDYVDNLPDHLTLTDEQKAKWRAWLGIE